MRSESISKRIKHREDMFLRRLFGILAKMAKIDGKVDAWEGHAAEGAFARFPRAMARRKFCVTVFNSSKNGRTPLGKLAAEFEKEWATPASKDGVKWTWGAYSILPGCYGTTSVFIKWDELESFK